MKIVDDLCAGLARDTRDGEQSRMVNGAVAPETFRGLPVIDISSVSGSADPGAILSFSGLVLRPPFDRCLVACRERSGVEFCVELGCLDFESGGRRLWRIWCSPYWLGGEFREPRYVANSWMIIIDKSGLPIDGKAFWNTLTSNTLDGRAHAHRLGLPEDGEFTASQAAQHFYLFDDSFLRTMFALSLLNCKNVRAVERPCSPKLAKRYEQRHGHKRPRYYVLDIEPMKQKFRDANGGKDGISLAKALHICRGHFKNFDEKKLFGKLKGTYWWQSHVRGDAESGIVGKGYRIKLP